MVVQQVALDGVLPDVIAYVLLRVERNVKALQQQKMCLPPLQYVAQIAIRFAVM